MNWRNIPFASIIAGRIHRAWCVVSGGHDWKRLEGTRLEICSRCYNGRTAC